MAVVLLFPLGASFSPGHIYWESIILDTSPDYLINLVSLIPAPTAALLAGLFIMLPGIIFEWQLKSGPISKKVRGRTALACFLSWAISLLLILSFEPIYGGSHYHTVILYTPILSISFYVLLPLISRETTIRSISKKHRNLGFGFVTSTLQRKFRRERVLSGLLWSGLVFGPFMAYWVVWYWTPQLYFGSLFYSSIIAFGGGVLFERLLPLDFNVSLISIDTTILPVIALFSAVRFLFMRDIFRYQSGAIKRSRLVSIAILGELLPSAVLTSFSFVSIGEGYVGPIFLPTPILPVIGFLFIRFSRVVPIKEELWPDYESRMWFEKELPAYVPEPIEETIKVPVMYLLVSQIRKHLRE
ncbi:MAG: hypothetical protein ACFFEK_09295 [Candidatus Thorarchaeota archaeon]